MKNYVEALIAKSAKSEKAIDAQQYAQAALNAASAIAVLNNVPDTEKG